MKKKVFCVIALCMGLFSSCDKDDIVFEEPIVPPIEEPENPSVIPSTDDLIRVKIDNDIMATVGSNAWYDIAYGNGRYVAVGYGNYYGSGFITISTDEGNTWSGPRQINKSIESIAFGNGKFITLSLSDDILLESQDGQYWDEFPKVGNVSWNKIRFANGKFFLLGHDGWISHSRDGIFWTEPKQVGASEGALWNDIEYGAGRYVVVGYGAINKRNIAASSTDDGDTWSSIIDMHNDYDYGLMSIAYGNGRFVILDADGFAFTSTDGGASWVSNRVDLYGDGFTNVIFTDGYFVGIGYGGCFFTSQLGGAYENWTRRTGNYSRNHLWGICAVK